MKRWIVKLLLLSVTLTCAQAAERIGDMEKEIQGILQKVSPSLVKVIAENGRRYIATGIAVEPDYIITSTEIVRHRIVGIRVETTSGKIFPVQVVGGDRQSGVLLLKLQQKALPALTIGGKVSPGNWIALLGVFYDSFPSICQGMVSSSDEEGMMLNAPAVPGSSGGAVVDRNGQLVGMIRGSFGFAFNPDYTYQSHSARIEVNGVRTSGGDLCYSIPVARLLQLSGDLKRYGRIRRGWFGVMLEGDSCLVVSVVPGSPAQKAGIVSGDLLTNVRGVAVHNMNDVAKLVRNCAPGERVRLVLLRQGKTRELEAEIGILAENAPAAASEVDETEMPETDEMIEVPETPEAPEISPALPPLERFVLRFTGSRRLGMELLEISAELAAKFQVREGFGLLVSSVSNNSAAAKAGIKAGDVLVRARNRELRSLTDLRQVLRPLKDKEAITLECYRDGQARKFSVVPEKSRDFPQEIIRLGREFRDLAELSRGDRDIWLRDAQELKKHELERQQEKARIVAELKVYYQKELEKLRLELEKLRQQLEEKKKKT
jgi:serine protease Do